MAETDDRDPPEPDDALISALLERAFAPSRPGSVLERVRARTGATPRVALRPSRQRAAPATADPALWHARYEVFEPLGEGGMGQVLRGRDVDLGRDVALKVLRTDRLGRAEAVQRFVEEAQIGGQLEHPGVLPIYELGMSRDGRPFIAMRLVEGRTLADLLSERTAGGESRARLLAIFEQVCQAIAYAHSRGVVHRDVKPSNVMVGTFDEVQVMDWGLAKVLGPDGSERPFGDRVVTSRSGEEAAQSTTGTVLGTPAYMAPEQARGEVELVDARSDVFSLGSMLCEILTGAPAYAGGDSSELQRKARAADLAGAHRRLAATDADPALRDIARDCLREAPHERPPDARVVTARLRQHSVSVELRAERAKLEAAEARGRAEEASERLRHERRARRLSLALGGAIVLTAALAGGGYLSVQAERRQREQMAANAIADQLDEARRQQRASGDDPASALVALDAAVAAAQRAEELARSEGADVGLSRRAQALVAELREEATRVRREHATQERDRETADRLEWLHLRSFDELRDRFPGDWDWVEQDREYDEVFRGFGIDLESMPTAEVAKAVMASDIATELIVGLQDWARVRGHVVEPGATDRRQRDLQAVVTGLYPDPWGRVFSDRGDVAALCELAQRPDLDQQPPRLLGELIDALGALGDVDLAIVVGRRAQSAHPADFRLHIQLGYWLWRRQSAGDLAEAVACYRAAVALRPSSAVTWFFLAWRLFDLGEKERPLSYLKHLIELQPNLAWSYYELAGGYAQVGDREKATEYYRKAVEMKPDYAQARLQLGADILEQGDVEGAIAQFEKVVELAPDLALGWADLGAAYARREDSTGAEAACEKALELEPARAEFWYNLGVARWKKGDYRGAEEAYARGAELGDLDAGNELCRTRGKLGDALGAIAAHEANIAANSMVAIQHETIAYWLQLMGDVAGAIAHYRTTLTLDPERSQTTSYLAQLLERFGQYDEAVALWDRLKKLADAGDLPEKTPYTAEHVEECRRAAALAPNLEEYLQGRRAAEDAPWIALARLCHARERPVAAVAFYRRALAADGEVAWSDRLDAAAAALRAAAGSGGDARSIGADQRLDLQQWARSLLERELAARLESPGDVDRELRILVQTLRHHTALAAVRGGDGEAPLLDALPPAEREAWAAFWARVGEAEQKFARRPAATGR